jgi:uncharacterized protein YbjT (DUF2867 family)
MGGSDNQSKGKQVILISGATGRVGTSASLALQKQGIAFRALVRDRAKFALQDSADVEIVEGDFQDEASLRSAMAGVTRALLVTGNGPDQASNEHNFATIAAESGVQHLIKVSSLEAADDATTILPKMHFASEQYIESLGLDWTFLRPNFFMQNLLLYAGSIANAGLFALPLGDAKAALIDARDVGEIAAKALSEDGHGNKIYRLNGPELLTFGEVAARMSKTLGKSVKYVDQSPEDFRATLMQFVPSEQQVDAICGVFSEIAKGVLEELTPTAKDVLGREPRSIEQFTKDFAAAFSA